MSHADLIDELGGTAAIANKLKLAQPVVANWRNRGIAWQWRPAIVELAKAKNVDVPEDFLVPTKQKPSQPEKPNGGPAPDAQPESSDGGELADTG